MIEYESLARSNSTFAAELEAVASRVIRSGWYVLGREVSAFEEEFANYTGSKHCISVANGLDALILAIEALDLPLDSEILVASNTYIATILAIIRAGHRPVLVEPNIDTFNIDHRLLEASLTMKTKAICVTHLFGKACRMDAIGEFAAQHGLKVIEDCAQSHGAKLAGKMTGTFGDAGCFSFYPTKNLGAFGDGGAIVTDSDELADRILYTRNYGSKQKYINEYIGMNSRLDEIQAGLLRVKLKHIERLTEYKRSLANIYFENLPSWLTLPRLLKDEYDVFHIYAVRTKERERLRKWLLDHEIKTEVHYPIPPHKQKAMKGILVGNYPIAECLHASEISLPISYGHTPEEIIFVCQTIKRFK